MYIRVYTYSTVGEGLMSLSEFVGVSLAPALHPIIQGSLILCAASVQLILKLSLMAEEDKERKRTGLCSKSQTWNEHKGTRKP